MQVGNRLKAWVDRQEEGLMIVDSSQLRITQVIYQEGRNVRAQFIGGHFGVLQATVTRFKELNCVQQFEEELEARHKGIGRYLPKQG